MGYQVAFSPTARRDLRDIVRYISFDAPTRGLSFGQLLIRSAKELAEFPERGRVVPEFGLDALREIVVRPYRIIYRVDHADCRIDIVRFWHGARGTPTINEI
jgi:addiction module RelE/StbE family toxin